MRVKALQRTATHCNTLQHTATHCNTLQHTATHRNTLQRTATHCNTLQHTATHCNTLQHTARERDAQEHNCIILQPIAVFGLKTAYFTCIKKIISLYLSACLKVIEKVHTLCTTCVSELVERHTATHCNTVSYCDTK